MDLLVRFLVVIFRIQILITSHISLVRLQLVVMLEIYSQVVWQMLWEKQVY